MVKCDVQALVVSRRALIVEANEKTADEEIEAARVKFRWGREQVELVKRVVQLMGIPYQTYIKQVVFKQALADLEEASAAGPMRR